jgi:hypothetical protein
VVLVGDEAKSYTVWDSAGHSWEEFNNLDKDYFGKYWYEDGSQIYLGLPRWLLTSGNVTGGTVGTSLYYGEEKITLENSITLTAQWKYNVTANCGEGGKYAKANPDKALLDDEITLTAEPDDDFEFVKWTVNNGDVTLADDTAAETTFKMPAADVTVTAIFEQKASTTPEEPSEEEPPEEETPTPTPTSKPEQLNPSSTPTPSPTPVFIDEHFAYIVGYPDGTVRPESSVTRAEVTTVFFRLLTDAVRDANWASSNNYSDVQGSEWFNNAVSTMSKMHIVNGYSDGTFKPNGYITRAELAAIAARFARQTEATVTNGSSFTDISDSWAELDILYAASVGWVNGYPDGTFKPERPITRAEFMALVNRMLERAPEFESDIITSPPQEWLRLWSDNADSSTWYYLDVQEATNSHYYVRKSTTVPNLSFKYETWTALREPRDWTELE